MIKTLQKLLFFSLFTLSVISVFAQEEQPVSIKNCTQDKTDNKATCFMDTLNQIFIANFELPPALKKSGFKQDFSILFKASKDREYTLLYISHKTPELEQEVQRVFRLFPDFSPATYNGEPIDKQYILPYHFSHPEVSDKTTLQNMEKADMTSDLSGNPMYRSNLNIPLTFSNYRSNRTFEFSENAHTAVKPYIFKDVARHIDFDTIHNQLHIPKTSWFGRKLWNENMLDFQGDNYWFHLDPIVDLQMGKENAITDYTYNNTRGVRVEGGIAKRISFSSSIFENQGRFADYFNRYALYKKPSSEAYAIVPGRDTSKDFRNAAFDYPYTTAYISWNPLRFMNIQFGHDKNFIGEGYRSLFLSDVGAPYTFVKINTHFWKIQYTNMWTWLRDVNTTTADDEPYKRKYMALHYLSWNATRNLNIGLFESVVWAKTPERGFDPHYLNPVIIFRALEYSNGSRAGNALLGVSASYNILSHLRIYSQFVLDELNMKQFANDPGYWANKYGYQLGAKYFDAFSIPNLYLQAEYNFVRPFTYSHSKPVLNYGHVNQPLAHLWESNFKEFSIVAAYQKGRWSAQAKIITGSKGFDVNSETDSNSYGGDIFRSNTEKNSVFGVHTGQGNKAAINIGELQAGYLINPASGLKVFGSVLYRDFSSAQPNFIFENKKTTWINLGIRTDINNWYFDF